MPTATTDEQPTLCFEDLLPEYGRKVKTFARNSYYLCPGWDPADMEQELLMVLWNTSQNFDPSRGCKFNTLFQRNAVNRIISLKRHYNTQSRKADLVSLDVEAVQGTVEEFLTTCDAETRALAAMEVKAYVAVHGEEGWHESRRGRRKVA
jgi:DNA-directed RNA polymerase specialized sigma24 family protein